MRLYSAYSRIIKANSTLLASTSGRGYMNSLFYMWSIKSWGLEMLAPPRPLPLSPCFFLLSFWYKSSMLSSWWSPKKKKYFIPILCISVSTQDLKKHGHFDKKKCFCPLFYGHTLEKIKLLNCHFYLSNYMRIEMNLLKSNVVLANFR